MRKTHLLLNLLNLLVIKFYKTFLQNREDAKKKLMHSVISRGSFRGHTYFYMYFKVHAHI